MSVPVTPPRPVRVSLAHESELVTRGFTEMVAPHACRVELVPAYSDGAPALDVDVTLHDSLAGLGSGPVAGPLLPTGYAGALVVYTWNPRPGLIELALAHGARGCLDKSLTAPALVAALEAVHRGGVVVECGPRREEPAFSSAPLTPREADIVSLITRGLDNVGVARQTSLSINSVKTYIRSAYRKMGVTSRSQAVLWGVRNGYLEHGSTDPWPEPAELTG